MHMLVENVTLFLQWWQRILLLICLFERHRENVLCELIWSPNTHNGWVFGLCQSQDVRTQSKFLAQLLAPSLLPSSICMIKLELGTELELKSKSWNSTHMGSSDPDWCLQILHKSEGPLSSYVLLVLLVPENQIKANNWQWESDEGRVKTSFEDSLRMWAYQFLLSIE